LGKFFNGCFGCGFLFVETQQQSLCSQEVSEQSVWINPEMMCFSSLQIWLMIVIPADEITIEIESNIKKIFFKYIFIHFCKRREKKLLL